MKTVVNNHSAHLTLPFLLLLPAGVEFQNVPEVPAGVPLVCDMSSNYFTRHVDVSKVRAVVVLIPPMLNLFCSDYFLSLVDRFLISSLALFPVLPARSFWANVFKCKIMLSKSYSLIHLFIYVYFCIFLLISCLLSFFSVLQPRKFRVNVLKCKIILLKSYSLIHLFIYVYFCMFILISSFVVFQCYLLESFGLMCSNA